MEGMGIEDCRLMIADCRQFSERLNRAPHSREGGNSVGDFSIITSSDSYGYSGTGITFDYCRVLHKIELETPPHRDSKVSIQYLIENWRLREQV
jgi:hypothetical protein